MRGSNQPLAFLLVVAVGLILRVSMVLLLPPSSDVYYYDTQAASLVLNGVDPYGHQFTGIPPELATPGAQTVFGYLPFTAIFVVPFYLLGDIRFAGVAADLIIGVSLFQFSRRWSFPVAALFLLLPATYFTNDAAFAAALVALSLAFESRSRKTLASVSLGLALASSLFAWLALPFFAYRYFRRGEAAQLVFALATAAFVCAPFIAASPSSFFYDALLFQFARPTPTLFTLGGPFGFSVNPSLSGLVTTFGGEPAPFYLRVAIALIALVLLLYKTPRSAEEPEGEGYPLPEPSGLLRCAFFVTIAVFVIPSVFFFAYLELPLVLVLAWLAGR